MADIGASVLARLKNKAADSGRSYQLCMQLFCQEEFLRRNAALKAEIQHAREHLVDGAVAAGRDQAAEAVARGLQGELPGM